MILCLHKCERFKWESFFFSVFFFLFHSLHFSILQHVCQSAAWCILLSANSILKRKTHCDLSRISWTCSHSGCLCYAICGIGMRNLFIWNTQSMGVCRFVRTKLCWMNGWRCVCVVAVWLTVLLKLVHWREEMVPAKKLCLTHNICGAWHRFLHGCIAKVRFDYMRFMDFVVHIIRNIDCNFTLHFQSNFPSNTLRFESIIVRLLKATYEMWLSREHLIRNCFFLSLSFSFDKTKFFWRISFWFRNLFENCKPLDFKICDFLEFTLSLYECTLHTEWLWSNLNILQFHGLSIIKVLLINWWSHFHCADGVKYSIAEHKTGVYWNLLAWFYWRTSMSIEIKWYNTLALWIKYLYRKHLFSNSVKIDGQFCKSAKKFKLNFSSNKCKIVKLEISSPKWQDANKNDCICTRENNCRRIYAQRNCQWKLYSLWKKHFVGSFV